MDTNGKLNKENTVCFFAHKTELTKEEDICLNNVIISEFKDDNNLYFLSNEHYYQAYKFANENIKEEFKDSKKDIFKTAFEEVRQAPDCTSCKTAARKYEKELENYWNKDKWTNGQKDVRSPYGIWG